MSPAATDGLLLADKPAGVTSHDVVLAARRAFGEKRIGHAGTLDPFATGLLVLLFGRATRLLPYLDGSPKEYVAEIRFGSETDTDDIDGSLVRAAPPPLEADMRAAILKLTGDLEQIPPAYSAKKVDGKRAYESARRGESVDLKPARVTVFDWRDIQVEGETLRATIECGGGTYIRALARDLGRLTGSAAHLASLRRTRSGPFRVDQAAALEDIREKRVALRPALDALPSTHRVVVDGESAERLLSGIHVGRTGAETTAALIDERSNALLAFAEADGEFWQPRVVMHKVEAD